MENTEKKPLFFVTDQPDTLKSVTAFLQKRGYTVLTESDLKEAVVKIMEVNPQFVFLTWDHADKKATLIPQILAQSSAASIIPYINKNTKESVFKFANCPYNPKLYPPISGPAIERLMLKILKDDASTQKKILLQQSRQANKDELKRVQQAMVDRLTHASEAEVVSAATGGPADKVTSHPPTALDTHETQIKPAPVATQTPQELVEQNQKLNGIEQSRLGAEQIQNFKSNLEDSVKLPLENLMNSQHEQTPPQKQKKSELIFQKGISHGTQGQTMIIQTGPTSSFRNKKPGELIETDVLKVYSLSLVSRKWCGYFIVSTQAELNFTQVDLAFTDWLKLQFPDLADLKQSDYFEFHDMSPEIVQSLKRIADYTENLNVAETAFDISFISVPPAELALKLTADRKYIEVNLDTLQTGSPLAFELLLHLPENQRYLLYNAENATLSPKQKDRLLAKKVMSLFVPVAQEKSYREFVMKAALLRLHRTIQSEAKAL